MNRLQITRKMNVCRYNIWVKCTQKTLFNLGLLHYAKANPLHLPCREAVGKSAFILQHQFHKCSQPKAVPQKTTWLLTPSCQQHVEKHPPESMKDFPLNLPGFLLGAVGTWPMVRKRSNCWDIFDRGDLYRSQGAESQEDCPWMRLKVWPNPIDGKSSLLRFMHHLKTSADMCHNPSLIHLNYWVFFPSRCTMNQRDLDVSWDHIIQVGDLTSYHRASRGSCEA